MLFTLQKQLQVNVLGSVRPTKVLLPDMIEKQQGRIVFISSMAGQVSLSIHCCNNVCLTYCFLSLCQLHYTKIAGLYTYLCTTLSWAINVHCFAPYPCPCALLSDGSLWLHCLLGLKIRSSGTGGSTGHGAEGPQHTSQRVLPA